MILYLQHSSSTTIAAVLLYSARVVSRDTDIHDARSLGLAVMASRSSPNTVYCPFSEKLFVGVLVLIGPYPILIQYISADAQSARGWLRLWPFYIVMLTYVN